MAIDKAFDAVIIGGGFYGSAIAIYLSKQKNLKNILIVEREQSLLTRASYNNQARIHNGYHYPRSFTTAYRSRVNFPKFVRDFPQAVKQDFTKLYAIARRNSKVTGKQFVRFCHDIGANIQPADTSLKKLFTSHLVEDVFLVDEYVFDAAKLANLAKKELEENGVTVEFNTRVTGISRDLDNGLYITMQSNLGLEEQLKSRYVFNCTYSGLNQFTGDFPGTQTGLKQEITEMALINVPSVLQNLGITVMDGPFFSIMPFPAQGLHTLSHVRYTPHLHWYDSVCNDPYQKLNEYDQQTRVDRMIRDVTRYLPVMNQVKYVSSLFEIKTVLMKNEGDDGRPILFEKHINIPGCYSVLGGKIDNIYDVLEKLETEEFSPYIS